jgi:hypothetical protein
VRFGKSCNFAPQIAQQLQQLGAMGFINRPGFPDAALTFGNCVIAYQRRPTIPGISPSRKPLMDFLHSLILIPQIRIRSQSAMSE